jgi:TatD DNase family protein
LTLRIIDTHAHLDMPEFNRDREEVIDRAKDKGVSTIITIGIDLESCRKAIDLAEKHPGIWAGIGIHPQESKGVSKQDVDKLEELARHPKVVGIGELGLDYYHKYSPKESQLTVLYWQLEIAERVSLPIIVHCRQAQEDMLPIIRDWCQSYKMPEGKPRGVLHCFSGEENLANIYMDMGFYISLGGYIGYPSSAKLRDTIKNIPSDKIVVETDCPFLPPQKYRGKRNEPAYTAITMEALAKIKGISFDEMARQTTENAIRVFNLNIQ